MVKFLRLPNLVKDLVFKEMELNEILLLSFCSKRVQKSIKQFRIESNKGFRITCGMNDPEKYHWEDKDEKRLELIVDHKENDKKVINWKYVNSLDNLDLLKEFKYLEDMYRDEDFDIELKSGFVFEINGLKCKYSISFDPKSGIPTLYFEKIMMKKWPMELHKYCVDLFRTTPDLEMIMNLNDSSDLHESQTIKDLYLHNSYERLNPKIAEGLFEKTHIQNRFSVFKQSLEGSVSNDSKLWKIPNLSIYCSGWVFARQLTRFTGKNAYLSVWEHSDCSGIRDLVDISQDLNAFLKHWLNSDNTNLESMIVMGYCSSPEGVFGGIKASRWDPKRRPARYVLKESFGRVLEHRLGEPCRLSNGLSYWRDRLNCTDAFDIIRESDGLIASVKVEYCAFSMFVWHSKCL